MELFIAWMAYGGLVHVSGPRARLDTPAERGTGIATAIYDRFVATGHRMAQSDTST